jgi:hypothetical protein
MKWGHLVYTLQTPGFCFFDGRMTCSLSVFKGRVLSVMLKHKGELITGRSSKLYYNFHNLYSSSFG